MNRAAGVRLILEIAVTSSAGAYAAQEGGADRVELCSALELGGVTPSNALIENVLAAGLPTHVLVRCRPGDFVYDADEVALMAAEVRSAVASGATGVVIGALTSDGALDTGAIQRLIDAAGIAVDITLHRAIDQAADPVSVAMAAQSLGLTRILTSGGAATAADGADTIAKIVAAVPGVEVMAGAGVRPSDVARLAAAGVKAVHLSAKRPAPARSRGTWVPMGVAGSSASTDTHFVTDPDIVAQARAAADAVFLKPGFASPGPG